MPTYDYSARFLREYMRLTPRQRELFRLAVQKLVHDPRAGDVRAGLPVKSVSGHPNVHELTWADDGRATFTYGESIRSGHIHVRWRRIGTHDILNEP
jgi:hypothetical protein